jgi:hypothetical protein
LTQYTRTARRCRFCTNESETREHAFPEWLLELLGSSPASRIEAQFGPLTPPRTWLGRDGILLNRFCGICQHGWMSDLETVARPIIGPLTQDFAGWLSREQQRIVACWAVKTAMVFEGINDPARWFYSDTERASFVSPSAPPPGTTLIWIGRYAHSDASYGQGRRLGGDNQGVLHEGYATTFALGRLVIQILTMRLKERLDVRLTLDIKRGRWNDSLVKIWPVGAPSVWWPPSLSFGTSWMDLDELSERFKA